MGSEQVCEASTASQVRLLHGETPSHLALGLALGCTCGEIWAGPGAHLSAGWGWGPGLPPSVLPCICLLFVELDTLIPKSLSFQKITHSMDSLKN